MLATFTPAVLTPLTFEEADAALTAALPKGSSIAVRALALAKTALETGRWKKIWCFNYGNVKAGDTYQGMFTSFACGEELAAGSCWFEPDGTTKNLTKGTVTKPVAYDVPPGHPQTRFRAYANAFDGAFEYVDFVNSGRYAQAWLSLLAGDAAGYVHNLKLKGYFTAVEAPYLAGVASMQREFEARLSNAPTVIAAVVDWDAIHACARLALSHPSDNLGTAGRDVADYENGPNPPTTDDDPVRS
jgi:hypothetical protein